MSTGLALETDVSGALRSCFSFSYGLPVSERSAATCEEKKMVSSLEAEGRSFAPYRRMHVEPKKKRPMLVPLLRSREHERCVSSVMGSLMYGAGHCWNGAVNMHLRFPSLEDCPEDEEFLRSFDQNDGQTGSLDGSDFPCYFLWPVRTQEGSFW